MTQSWIPDFLIANKHLLFSEKLTHYMTHAYSVKKPRNNVISYRGILFIQCLNNAV